MILADTIETDSFKNENKFCSKRAKVWIAGRSIYSTAKEKLRKMESKEVAQLSRLPEMVTLVLQQVQHVVPDGEDRIGAEQAR
jgi:uncharacterized protein YifN (PemK superfamily)